MLLRVAVQYGTGAVGTLLLGPCVVLLSLLGLRRDGRHLLVFPEGSRCPDDGMLPFKKGGFHLAVAAQVPIVPVAVNGSRRLFPKGEPASPFGNVEVSVGEPIATAGLGADDVPELLERTRSAIVALRRRDPDFVG
jgi:1-acyl-sn-glycerol-3-phosphate acyltransferase